MWKRVQDIWDMVKISNNVQLNSQEKRRFKKCGINNI